MPDPLNPQLYAALQARFGDVRIANPGQERIVERERDTTSQSGFRDRPVQRGEQYAVCCPFCGDDWFRLYISYQYGQKDPTGRANYHLCYCQNECCHESISNREQLRSMLALRPSQIQPAPTAAQAPPEPQKIVYPESVVPIASLPASHPAVKYLAERGFDAQELQQLWEVGFCDACFEAKPNAVNRLIYPIYNLAKPFTTPNQADPQLVLAGWQARLVPGLEPLAGADSKYLSASGMQRSEVLYGLHHALQGDGPVVVVEGATDVWRVGPGAVAILGKVLSRTQKLLLVHHFAGRPIVVMLDPDARDAANLIQRELQRARGGGEDNEVVVASTPDDRDPGDCTQQELLESVAKALGISPEFLE